MRWPIGSWEKEIAGCGRLRHGRGEMRLWVTDYLLYSSTLTIRWSDGKNDGTGWDGMTQKACHAKGVSSAWSSYYMEISARHVEGNTGRCETSFGFDDLIFGVLRVVW
jgi:hypothetical protein